MALFLLSPVLPPKVQLLTLEFEFSALSLLQLSCPSVQAMLANTSLQVLPIPYRNSTVLCDVSSTSIRHLVPTSLWKQLFSALYRISHPGVRASSRLISSRLSGLAWPRTLASGLEAAFLVNKTRSRLISSPHGSKHSSSWMAFCSRSHWSPSISLVLAFPLS